MTKTELKVVKRENNKDSYVKVQGYLCEIDKKKLFVHRSIKWSKYWVVSEPQTGLLVSRFTDNTRKNAIKNATKRIKVALARTHMTWKNIIAQSKQINT